jgi:CRP-like cAMP-binding protein
MPGTLRANQLLSELPREDFERLRPHLVLTRMRLGQALYESGSTPEHVYFPVAGIISMLYVTTAGDSAELAVVGREGMIGVSLFMGDGSTTNRAVVQSECLAYRLHARKLKEEFARGEALHRWLLTYTQALITQIGQTAVCNRHHSVAQQLARWLLLSLDCLSGNELKMTQELIANMLGVRRQGVTEAAHELETDGLIRYKRGAITVLDRPGLEARSCECYRVVRREYDRLLGYRGGVLPPPS